MTLAFALLPLTACSPPPPDGSNGANESSAGSDAGSGAGSAAGLDDPVLKDIAMQIVSSAENSSLDWKAQYKYIEDIDDGRGYTGGVIGFCSGCGDMLKVVERYTRARPGNPLEPFTGALRAAGGGDSHQGLGRPFTEAWARAAGDPEFRAAQDAERDRAYFDPALAQAERDGLGALGQFIYFDAHVMHGLGDTKGTVGFRTMRDRAMAKAEPPSRGGDEKTYLAAFLDVRVAAIDWEPSHSDTSRIESAQRIFLREGKLGLERPLRWKVYGDSFRIG
ncbi:chitosanase [Streptomyces sp. H27-C3]|uniref:chitosanase n=1 Tax=Streptomyces sp. H27-C3 TaxID=3046305 RepID=UPI0024BACF3B|nr:chitosanase [Streptomyces sp. H27-C3]MDJ0462577.1 chitosanase [Streptomyces sp. H27-C3]